MPVGSTFPRVGPLASDIHHGLVRLWCIELAERATTADINSHLLSRPVCLAWDSDLTYMGMLSMKTGYDHLCLPPGGSLLPVSLPAHGHVSVSAGRKFTRLYERECDLVANRIDHSSSR